MITDAIVEAAAKASQQAWCAYDETGLPWSDLPCELQTQMLVNMRAALEAAESARITNAPDPQRAAAHEAAMEWFAMGSFQGRPWPPGKRSEVLTDIILRAMVRADAAPPTDAAIEAALLTWYRDSATPWDQSDGYGVFMWTTAHRKYCRRAMRAAFEAARERRDDNGE